MVSERYHQKNVSKKNQAFVFLAVIGLHLGQRSRFQAEVLHLARYLSAHDFN